MNAAEIITQLVQYGDHRTLSEAETAGAEYLNAALEAVNAAAQQIYISGPDTLSRRTYGFTLDAPASVNVSHSSSAWTMPTGWDASFTGRTFKINSESVHNRITAVGTTPDFSAERAPAADLTAVAATVWHDAIALPAEITHVLPGVTLDEEIPMRAATSQADLYAETRYRFDYGERFRYANIATKPPLPARPSAYFVTSFYPVISTATQPGLFVRISPFPDASYVLTIAARVRPTRIVLADLDASNDGAACNDYISLPADWDELFLLPIAKQFLTASPYFKNEGVKAEIARASASAIDSLSKMRPQVDRPVRFVPTV